MDVLKNAIQEMEGDMIVASDLNAKALEWACPNQSVEESVWLRCHLGWV